MPCVYLPGPAPAVTVANIYTLSNISWKTANPTIHEIGDRGFSCQFFSKILRIRERFSLKCIKT